MTDFTCTNCNLQFSLPISGDDLRCPKCGQSGLAERLPDVLEEVDSPAAAEVDVPATTSAPVTKAPVPSRRPARSGAPTVRRGAARTAAPAEAPRRSPTFAIVVGVAVLGVGAAGYIVMNRGDDRGTSGSPPGQAETVTSTEELGRSASTNAEAPPPSTGDPRRDFEARRARLAPNDLSARKELLEFCREHSLDDARGPLLREILLLDSEDEVGRRSFGFSRHTNDSSPFHGRWLTKADADLAAAYDALLAK